jgi:hypothetical protein
MQKSIQTMIARATRWHVIVVPYDTYLRPELFRQRRMLSRGHFWRLEAREVRITKLELQAVNPPPEPTERWSFCFWAQIFTAQKGDGCVS